MRIESSKDMVARANAAVDTLAAEQASALVGRPDAVFVDVRDAAEREKTGTVKGAVHAPRAFLEFMADPASERHVPELSSGKRLVLFCASGGRSALAAKTLKDMGYEKVAHVAGGFSALAKAGAPIEHR
jgi:rhodanese-related sulfurtransferase